MNAITPRTLIAFIAASMLCACGPEETGTDPAPFPGTTTGDSGTGGTSGGGGSSTATINGKPAAEYFAQFHWDEKNSPVEGAVAFPETNGKDLFISSIFLMKNGEFVLFYVEGQGTVTLTGHSAGTDPQTAVRTQGTWQVVGAELKLGARMTCRGGPTVNSKETLSCALQSPLGTSAAVGHSGVFRIGFPSSPTDSEWAGYRNVGN